jgi:hypothetical protein
LHTTLVATRLAERLGVDRSMASDSYHEAASMPRGLRSHAPDAFGADPE